ncbi:hypothetical protein ACNF42_00455 [Cuniculiplasma sp. SKW3]|uniref:hypothetical protein n=1 Tax=Cuniculiplasma sp. SKW3 TaxID=3400170 RepID=UPI003FD52CAC
MLYSEVDKRLDMAISISTEIKSSFLPLIERDYGKLPVYIHIVDGKMFMDVYLVINGKEKFDINSSIYKSIIKEPYQIIRLELKEIPGSALLTEDLLNIPSLLFSYMYIENSRLCGRMRFHHSDLKNMNRIISKISESSISRIDSLGPSDGGIRELNWLNEILPLWVISYDQDLPDEWKFTSNMETYSEVKPQRSIEGKYQLIFYGGKGVKDIPGRVISENPLISLISGTSPIANQLWIESNKNFVSRISVLAKQADGVARTVIIMPAVLADEQMRILSRIGKNYADTNFRINAYMKYSSEVWNWI